MDISLCGEREVNERRRWRRKGRRVEDEEEDEAERERETKALTFQYRLFEIRKTPSWFQICKRKKKTKKVFKMTIFFS